MGTGAQIYEPAVIANGASLSGEIDLKGAKLVGIIMPAAWTAAKITLQAAEKAGGTFQEVFALNHLDGAAVAVTFNVAQAQFYALANSTVTDTSAASQLDALRWIKVRSGTSGLPVNQGAERVVTLVLEWK